MLILGTDKTDTVLEHLPESYLLIDDGPVIDAVTFPKRRKVTHLDFSTHALNPLKGMSYQKARQFIAILDAIFPEGADTLTKKTANFIILKALLRHRKKLDTLIWLPEKPTSGQYDAYQKIETLLLSPLLKHFLTSPTERFSVRGIVIARLDRATLGDFDCFVLGNLLAANYPKTVVMTDFGFYATPPHIQLMRQQRLIAGLSFLDEVPTKIRQQLLLMPTKLARRCTFDDAEILAGYAGLAKGTVAESDFIAAAIK